MGDRVQVGEVADDEKLLPIVPYIARNAAGMPEIVGRKCAACGEIFVGNPSGCARCGARITTAATALATTGRLYVWTTVHRSLPGIATPFIFAIVDLDGGGVIKGTLVAVETDIELDMPVRIVFKKADRSDSKGRSYLTYYFIKS